MTDSLSLTLSAVAGVLLVSQFVMIVAAVLRIRRRVVTSADISLLPMWFGLGLLALAWLL